MSGNGPTSPSRRELDSPTDFCKAVTELFASQFTTDIDSTFETRPLQIGDPGSLAAAIHAPEGMSDQMSRLSATPEGLTNEFIDSDAYNSQFYGLMAETAADSGSPSNILPSTEGSSHFDTIADDLFKTPDYQTQAFAPQQYQASKQQAPHLQGSQALMSRSQQSFSPNNDPAEAYATPVPYAHPNDRLIGSVAQSLLGTGMWMPLPPPEERLEGRSINHAHYQSSYNDSFAYSDGSSYQLTSTVSTEAPEFAEGFNRDQLIDAQGAPPAALSKGSQRASMSHRLTSFGITSPDYRRQHFVAELPKKDRAHDWVRVNGATEGKSSRTGKINAWHPAKDGKYLDLTPHPIGDWTGLETKTRFEYTRHGELKARTFSPMQINDFLFSHVANPGSSLTIWIQRCPADSGRRYETQQSDKCIFDCCPASGRDHRNILVGHLRVSFDEQWEHYREKRNPLYVAGYAHLYCIERFCDFPAICQLLNVKPDRRFLAGEPRSKWGASLGDDRVYQLAREFIDLSRCQKVQDKYPQYPFLSSRGPAEPLPFEQTLTYVLTDAKIQETSRSKVSMMHRRGLKPTNILIHKGDLQKLINTKEQERRIRRSVTTTARSRKRLIDADGSESEMSSALQSETEYTTRPRFTRTSKRKAAHNPTTCATELLDEEMEDIPASWRKHAHDSDDDSDALSTHPAKRSKQHISRVAPVASMQEPPVLTGPVAPLIGVTTSGDSLTCSGSETMDTSWPSQPKVGVSKPGPQGDLGVGMYGSSEDEL